MTLQPELLGWLAETRARRGVSRTGASTAAGATGNTCARSASVPWQDEMPLLLTPQFDACAAMLAFLRDANTSQSVIDIFDGLERLLGLEVFRNVFPVILTDNGTEFSNPGAIERSVDGESVRTRVFYCDPYAAWQKPNVENNHRNLRRILPKGESMDFLTQEKVNLALSHMNSVIRASLGNVTAARRVAQCHGEDVLEKLGIGEIAPDQVRMTPELVRD